MNYSFCRKGLFVIAISCFLCLLPLRANAQTTVVPPEAIPDSTTIWHIITLDENEFFGMITGRSLEYIEINTNSLGTIQIPLLQIKQMKVVGADRIVEGELWPENVQASRYFLSSNGLGVRRGQGYYHNIWIFFNQVTFGIADFASLGVGMVPFVLSERLPIWLTPKLSIPLAGKDGLVHIGVSALWGELFSPEEDGFGAFTGSLTVGTRDRNVSIGLGKGLDGGELSEQTLLIFGAMLRTSRKSYLMVEGLLWDLKREEEGGILIGARNAGRNISLDFGVIIPVDEGETSIFPWLSVSIPFGN